MRERHLAAVPNSKVDLLQLTACNQPKHLANQRTVVNTMQSVHRNQIATPQLCQHLNLVDVVRIVVRKQEMYLQ